MQKVSMFLAAIRIIMLLLTRFVSTLFSIKKESTYL